MNEALRLYYYATAVWLLEVEIANQGDHKAASGLKLKLNLAISQFDWNFTAQANGVAYLADLLAKQGQPQNDLTLTTNLMSVMGVVCPEPRQPCKSR